jgi:hypothetical protein
MIDEKTTHQEYPLPHPDNFLEDDVERIRNSFELVDTDVNDLSNSISNSITDTQSGKHFYGLSTGLGNAYEISLDPSLTTLAAGQVVHITAHIQNTGAATLEIDGLGAKAIKKTDGSDLKSGDMIAGAVYLLYYDGTQFQVINPKADQKQVELVTSNLMLAFEEIQENHGGFLNMESGWSDSFSNANEQGVDEVNSSNFDHDITDKLYKGSRSGIILDSEKNFDSESNYLQQEWNKSQNGFGGTTSQATVASGITVTINSDISPNGKFPENCANGSISFDNGINWYGISSRDSDTQLTLKAAATNGIFDYIIRMSNFDTNKALLSSIAGFSIGDGRDGSVTISTSKNINTDILGSLRSVNADGISTSVTANPTGNSITVNSIAGFGDGDKFLLINMQGASGDITDVGNHEILTVDGVPFGSTIDVRETISKSYDGTLFSSQKVVCQRIPQWTDLNINSGGDLTCNAWDGTMGGLLTFYSSGTTTVTSGRTISANGKGYRGGVKSLTNGVAADQGESRTGLGSASRNANDGGGGGAEASNGDGGGGGYAIAGAAGDAAAPKEGFGGGTYGDTNLTNIFLGSGGGGGAYTVAASNGASGGGIIYIIAKNISISGDVTATGDISPDSGNGAYTQGGGGSGGSIFIRAESLTAINSSIHSTGGHTYWSTNKSKGGDGRTRLEYSTFNASAHPSSSNENDSCSPNPGSTVATATTLFASSEYVSLCDTEAQKTDTNTWMDITSASVTETLNSQNIYHWIAFDPAPDFGDGTEVKTFSSNVVNETENGNTDLEITNQMHWAIVDRVVSVGNLQEITHIGLKMGFNSTPPVTSIKVYKENSPTDYDVLYTEVVTGSLVNDVNNVIWYQLSTPYVTPATGTIRIGAYFSISGHTNANWEDPTSDNFVWWTADLDLGVGNHTGSWSLGATRLAVGYKYHEVGKWHKIARNISGTWKYNNATEAPNETWVVSPSNDMLHAVSKAIESQPANRMTGANLAAIPGNHWQEAGGWSTDVDSIVRGATLHSSSPVQSPSVSQHRLSYESGRLAMDLKSKAYDPGFVPSEAYLWAREEYPDINGPGVFSVSRNGDSEWETIPMIQQGLPFGNIRVMRSTVDLNGQSSGQDLRCRYQTEQGKDQFLHSWGLQAKP